MTRPGPNRANRVSLLNPIAAWRQNRRNRLEQEKEAAAREITNDMAENETRIINKLKNTDFISSRLPREVLEKKSDPTQNCCDLEHSVLKIANYIQQRPISREFDMRGFYQALYNLAGKFSDAVREGNRTTAEEALDALASAITKIHSRIPTDKEEAQRFVDASTSYMDTWIQLVEMAKESDNQERIIKDLEAELAKRREEAAENFTELRACVTSDSTLGQAFADIWEGRCSNNPHELTDEQREFNQRMIAQRLRVSGSDLAAARVFQAQKRSSIFKENMNVLHVRLAEMTISSDPDRINRFNQKVEEIFEAMARNDCESDEMMRMYDGIDGRLAQMAVAPGAVRMKEIVAEQTEILLKKIKEKQEIESGERTQREGAAWERLGLQSEEEIAARRQHNDELVQERLNQLVADLSEPNKVQETEILYN